MSSELIYKSESYELIGICMEVHRLLGKGFLEIVYKDALEVEFNIKQIQFKRETPFEIIYKNVKLPHKYIADFIIHENIILEVKSCTQITSVHVSQTLNYLAVTKKRLGIIVNFGEPSLTYKRFVL